MTRLDEQRSLLGGRMSDTARRRRLVELVRRRRGAPRLRQRLQRGAFGAARLDQLRRGQVRNLGLCLRPRQARLFGDGDRLGLRFSQPIRIESGGIATMLPTGYDYATGLTTSGLQRLSLSPSGREIDAELSYGTRLGAGWIGGNLFARRNPGTSRGGARRRRRDPHQLRFLGASVGGRQSGRLLRSVDRRARCSRRRRGETPRDSLGGGKSVSSVLRAFAGRASASIRHRVDGMDPTRRRSGWRPPRQKREAAQDDRTHVGLLGGTYPTSVAQDQTVKLSPQPQAPLALGLAKVKPAAKSSSTQSIVLPMR